MAKSRGWDPADGDFPISLYNLATDPGETLNVAEEHPELVRRLREKLERFDDALTREARPAGGAGSELPGGTGPS